MYHFNGNFLEEFQKQRC